MTRSPLFEVRPLLHGLSSKADKEAIEVDEDTAPYAVAGQNVTLYLSGIDPIHLGIGTVLCPTSLPVPLVTKFTAQILVFDLQTPIITGTAVSFLATLPAPCPLHRYGEKRGKSSCT